MVEISEFAFDLSNHVFVWLAGKRLKGKTIFIALEDNIHVCEQLVAEELYCKED